MVFQNPIIHHHIAYCWPFPIPSKKLELEIRLPKRVFAAVESIPIDFELHNLGLVPIRKIRIYLQKKVLFHNDFSTTRNKNKIGVFVLRNIQQVEFKHFTGYSLSVCACTPPSVLTFPCPIRTSYKFVIKICTSGSNTSVKAKIPIYIFEKPIETLFPPPTFDEVEAKDLPNYDDALKLKEIEK